MKTQSFSNNTNHRLILPVFQDVRLAENDSYELGEERIIRFKGAEIGTATVRAVKYFPFGQLTEPYSWAIVGKGLYYFRKMLMRFYPGVTERSRMALVTWEWQKRDMTALSEMMRDYWMGQLNLAGVAEEVTTLD